VSSVSAVLSRFDRPASHLPSQFPPFKPLTSVSIAVLYLSHSPPPSRADQARGGEFSFSQNRSPRNHPHISQSRCEDLSLWTLDDEHPYTPAKQHITDHMNSLGRRVP
jgi:hypothetical protein